MKIKKILIIINLLIVFVFSFENYSEAKDGDVFYGITKKNASFFETKDSQPYYSDNGDIFVVGEEDGDYIKVIYYYGNENLEGYFLKDDLIRGELVSGIVPTRTNVRMSPNGRLQNTVVERGSYIEAVKVGNWLVLDHEYFFYDFGLKDSLRVSGYLKEDTNVRDSINGNKLKVYYRGAYISGQKTGNWIKLDDGNYIYDFGLIQGSGRVIGYITQDTNVRTDKNTDSEIIDVYNFGKKIHGIRDGKWITLLNGNYIYDLGVSPGVEVKGYANADVNIRTSFRGNVVGKISNGDYIEGAKVGNYIILDENKSIYDFGFKKVSSISGKLKNDTNIRIGKNGKIVGVYPKGTIVEGYLDGGWIRLDNGFYLYNLGLDNYSGINTKKDLGITYNIPNQLEIYKKYHSYTSKSDNKITYNGLLLQDPVSYSSYEIVPNKQEFNPGKLTKNTQLDSLHVLNTIRFLNGLNQVNLSDRLSYLAQAGAFINDLNDNLSHSPDVPKGLTAQSQIYKDGYLGSSNSNISFGYRVINQNIGFLKDDIGVENLENVGHRGWILSPSLREVGIGQSGSYSQLHITSSDFYNDNHKIVPYPNRSTPTEWMSNKTPLSIFLSDEFDISNVDIEVTNLNDNRKVVYRRDLIKHEYYGSGFSKAIVFGNISKYDVSQKYIVRVKGLMRNGLEYPLEYTVGFFSLNL